LFILKTHYEKHPTVTDNYLIWKNKGLTSSMTLYRRGMHQSC